MTATDNLHLNIIEKATINDPSYSVKHSVTLTHLFTFENFFKLPLDPLDRDISHGCVCRTAAAAVFTLLPGPLTLCCLPLWGLPGLCVSHIRSPPFTFTASFHVR